MKSGSIKRAVKTVIDLIEKTFLQLSPKNVPCILKTFPQIKILHKNLTMVMTNGLQTKVDKKGQLGL